MFKLRVTVPYRFAIIALSLMMASSLTACKADSNYFATTNASIGSGDGTTSDGTAGFRVRLKAKTGVDAFMHKFGSVTEACEIPLSAPGTPGTGTPTSIQCMANLMEYDLWFYGLEYEFNVPKDTCDFVTVDPNFHYDAQPGRGPAAITLATLDGNITACNFDGVAGTVGGGVCSGVEGFINPAGTISCTYNYATFNAGSTAANCCSGIGRVVLTKSVTDAATGVVTVTTSTVDNNYGGGAVNCMRSPHDYIDSWPKLIHATGAVRARTFITELGKGALVRTTKIPSTYAVILQTKLSYQYSNFLNAGFHDWAAYVASATTWDTARTVPRAFQPLFDRGPADDHLAGSGATATLSAGDGSEDFRCLNGAGEVKLRIRMYTNEWNTVEDYTAYKAGGTASGAAPTVRGVTGVNCLSGVNTGPTCNTVWGFEDMLNENAAGLGAYVFPQIGWGRSSSPP